VYLAGKPLGEVWVVALAVVATTEKDYKDYDSLGRSARPARVTTAATRSAGWIGLILNPASRTAGPGSRLLRKDADVPNRAHPS
jgi:hypothetical protein